jgi:hypothetical protein
MTSVIMQNIEQFSTISTPHGKSFIETNELPITVKYTMYALGLTKIYRNVMNLGLFTDTEQSGELHGLTLYVVYSG